MNRDQLNLGHVPARIRTSPWEESTLKILEGDGGRRSGARLRLQRTGERGDFEEMERKEDVPPSALPSNSTDAVFTTCVCGRGGVRAHLFYISLWS